MTLALTLEVRHCGCAWRTRQQSQLPPYPHIDIAKIRKRQSATANGIRINLKKTKRIFQPNSHPPIKKQGG